MRGHLGTVSVSRARLQHVPCLCAWARPQPEMGLLRAGLWLLAPLAEEGPASALRP